MPDDMTHEHIDEIASGDQSGEPVALEAGSNFQPIPYDPNERGSSAQEELGGGFQAGRLGQIVRYTKPALPVVGIKNGQRTHGEDYKVAAEYARLEPNHVDDGPALDDDSAREELAKIRQQIRHS